MRILRRATAASRQPSKVDGATKRVSQRCGTTMVEFAIICPILFAFFFACIEFGRANHIKNAVPYAAYQGCRRAIVPGATANHAIQASQAVLTSALVKGGTITVTPSTITNSTPTVTVTVSVNLGDNAWTTAWLTKNKTVTRSCTFTREQMN